MATAQLAPRPDTPSRDGGLGTAGDGDISQHAPTLALVLLGEVTLALLHVLAGWGLAATLLGHLLIVGSAGRWLLATAGHRSDVTPAALIVLATAVSGPIGALLGLAYVYASRPPDEQGPLLAEWYGRIALGAEIDPVAKLCDDVACGRSMNLAAPPPLPFLAVMTGGSIADQQTALGLIARRFHPDYLPALGVALRSPEPVVRVQAAAVVARVRDELSLRVKERLSEASRADGGDVRRRALAELEKCVASGLLDEGDRRRAEELLAAPGAQHASLTGALAAADRHAAQPRLEQELLDHRRFKELRVLKRRRQIEHRGLQRVRGLRPGSALQRAT